MVYQTTFSYSNDPFGISAESRYGGLFFTINDINPLIPSGYSLWRFEMQPPLTIFPLNERTLIIALDPPDIRYSTLMLLAIAATTAWLTWRWRKTVAALSKCDV